MLPIAEVQFYDVVLFSHVLGVVLAFGPPFAYAVFFGANQNQSPDAMAAVGRGVLTWDRTVGTLAMVLILASGIYMAADVWDGSEFFIAWGIVAILLLFAMVHGLFIPKTRSFVQSMEAGDQDGAMKTADTLNKLGPVAGLIVILTIYVMVAKPFL